MWVTQTYLGVVEPHAKAFIYYLFEDYNSEQTEFTTEVQRRLEDIGEAYQDRVSLLMPNPRFAARIESEVRDKIQDVWWSLHGKLPGLLFSTKPLSQFDGASGEYVYFPFDALTAHGAAEVIVKVRRLANEQVSWDFLNPKKKEVKSVGKVILDAIEAKPGFAGFRIDLKKLKRS